MQIDTLITNAELAISRLESQMEALSERSRMKYDMVTVGIFEGKIDLLRSLGMMPTRVEKLQARIEEIRDEVRRNNEKEAA